MALGAVHGRVNRQHLFESLLLTATGGHGTGFALRLRIYAAAAVPPTQPTAAQLLDYTLDLRIVVYVMGSTAVSGLAVGVVPAPRWACSTSWWRVGMGAVAAWALYGLRRVPEIQSVAFGDSGIAQRDGRSAFDIDGDVARNSVPWPKVRSLAVSSGTFKAIGAQTRRCWDGISMNATAQAEIEPVVYVLRQQRPARGARVLARTAIPAQRLRAEIGRVVQNLDPEVPLWLGACTLTVPGGHLLASWRQQWAGLGSARRISPALVGLAAGLGASLGTNRLLSAQHVDAPSWDPLTLSVSCLVLLVATIAGCASPTRRGANKSFSRTQAR